MDLDQLHARRDELAALRDTLHECGEETELRRRIVAGGAVHLVVQCLVCGEQLGGPISKAAAAAKLRGQEPAAFDETTGKERLHRTRTLSSEGYAIEMRISQLLRPEAHAEREKGRREAAESEARARAALDGVAEAMGPFMWNRRMPFVIDHLQRRHPVTFDNPAAETVEKFESEAHLRQWLDAWLHEDFDAHPEVPGRHLARGTGVKIDYVLMPKQHLIDTGFKPGPIGLEVKHLPIGGGFSPKASRFVWQGVSYTDCEFDLNGQAVRLPRVLLFSNISFSTEQDLLRSHDPSPLANDRAKWSALLEMANHAGVGNFEMYGSREQRFGWRIAFATGVYFRRKDNEYSVSNARLFDKERIGSF